MLVGFEAGEAGGNAGAGACALGGAGGRGDAGACSAEGSEITRRAEAEVAGAAAVAIAVALGRAMAGSGGGAASTVDGEGVGESGGCEAWAGPVECGSPPRDSAKKVMAAATIKPLKRLTTIATPRFLRGTPAAVMATFASAKLCAGAAGGNRHGASESARVGATPGEAPEEASTPGELAARPVAARSVSMNSWADAHRLPGSRAQTR